MALAISPAKVGIDLGTANTIVYVEGKGIVCHEPSVVARHSGSGAILAIGREAYDMIGRTPKSITIVRPLNDGVIADFEMTAAMLSYFMRAAEVKHFIKPDVMICVPSGVTPVEQKAVRDAARLAGAREAYVVEEPFAAAVGAGLPVSDPTGSMVVDIGGGTTDVATISLNGIVKSTTLRIGGNLMNQAIEQVVKDEHQVLIGERTAESLKIAIGSASERFAKKYQPMTVCGRDLVTGLPKNITVDPVLLARVLAEPIDRIISAVKTILEETPPEITSDVIEHGIVLTGGGALLHNIADVVAQATKVPVFIANSPMACVAIGTGKILNDGRILKKSFKNSKQMRD